MTEDVEEGTKGGVIRRKLAQARSEAAEGGPGADRGWRLALARAARDELKLGLEVSAMTLSRASLAELLDLPPDRSMLVVLDGPGEGLGLLVLSPAILQGLVEVQTIGRVASAPVVARKPTRTDAAMVIGLIDRALAGLELVLAQEADLIWAGGFRYASFLDDARPLGLLLDDTQYRVMSAEVSLAMDSRTGPVILALPAEGRGKPPLTHALADTVAEVGPAFTEQLADRLSGADCALEAVLARLNLPLNTILRLREGEVLALPFAALDRISLEGLDGRRVGEGKLGQNRGMRALRLSPAAVPAQGLPRMAPPVAAPAPSAPAVPAAALRQAG